MEESQIKALISLLDDNDESIYLHVKEKLMDMGEEAVPHLEKAWEDLALNALFQERVESLIHEIQFGTIKQKLKEWNDKGGIDLFDAMVLIARFQYPDLDVEKVKKQVAQIEQDVWLEINDNLTALEKINVINHILFDVHNFSGNTTNYHSPQNSFINVVLETKKGNPISLAVLYSIIAQRLDLPVYGVNLPRHFILAYLDKYSLTGEKDIKVFFYINPFSRGMVFGKGDIDKFLEHLKLKPSVQYYIPCSNTAIIKRVLNNLEFSFKELGNEKKAEEIRILNELLEG